MKRRDFLKGCAAGGAVAVFDSAAFAAAVGEAQTLVLGGGMFALGYALAGKGVALERGMHLGADFAATCGPHKVGEPTTELGRKLRDALVAAELLRGGELELPPLADFLAVFFADCGGRVFLGAELADLAATSAGWRATIYGSGGGGLSECTVGRVVDTTDVAWRNRGIGDVAGARFGALTKTGYFNVDLPPDAGWREARLALCEAWEKSGEKGESLAEVNALRRIYKPGRIERTFDCGGAKYAWVPSAQFSTLIGAFEEGLKWNAR